MSHRYHPRRFSAHPHHHPHPERLPHNAFGALVGRVDLITRYPRLGTRLDDNHVYLWLRIDHGRFAGRYECAVNTRSSDCSAVEYCASEEETTPELMPPPGFMLAELSYSRLGLQQSDFQPMEGDTLAALIEENARACDLLCAYGVTYSNWHGMHDIHLNWGEPPESPYADAQVPNGDGALVFYFSPKNASPFRRWVFLKFAAQGLKGERKGSG